LYHRIESPWAQHEGGCLTLDPVLERFGLRDTARTLQVATKTVQRIQRRSLTIAQARQIADLFEVAVSDIWPELTEVDMPIGPVDWRDHAKCKGMDTDEFFPPSGTQASRQYEVLKLMCNRCPVREQCLKEALFIEEKTGCFPQGFVGGLTPAERRALLGFRETATVKALRSRVSA
jgi:WhiB family redox-sensing transcriptional regulator